MQCRPRRTRLRTLVRGVRSGEARRPSPLPPSGRRGTRGRVAARRARGEGGKAAEFLVCVVGRWNARGSEDEAGPGLSRRRGRQARRKVQGKAARADGDFPEGQSADGVADLRQGAVTATRSPPLSRLGGATDGLPQERSRHRARRSERRRGVFFLSDFGSIAFPLCFKGCGARTYVLSGDEGVRRSQDHWAYPQPRDIQGRLGSSQG